MLPTGSRNVIATSALEIRVRYPALVPVHCNEKTDDKTVHARRLKLAWTGVTQMTVCSHPLIHSTASDRRGSYGHHTVHTTCTEQPTSSMIHPKCSRAHGIQAMLRRHSISMDSWSDFPRPALESSRCWKRVWAVHPAKYH